MSTFVRRALTGTFIVSIVSAGLSLIAAPAAQAVPATSGQVTLQGNGNNAGTGFETVLADTPGGGLTVNVSGSQIQVTAYHADSRYWSISLVPPTGQSRFAPGVYPTSRVLTPTTAILRVVDNGKQIDCVADVTGEIEIHAITYGAGNAVEALDASFVQRCPGTSIFTKGRAQVNVAPTAAPQKVNGALAFSGHPVPALDRAVHVPGWSVFLAARAEDDGRTVSVMQSPQVGVDSAAVVLGAPAGQRLAVGTYTGASSRSDGTTPRISLNAASSRIAVMGGSFTVKDIALGADGRVDRLDATYEIFPVDPATGQPATRPMIGRVLVNPAFPLRPTAFFAAHANQFGTVTILPAPRPLTRTSANLSGTVSCEIPATVRVDGVAVQNGGSPWPFTTTVDCDPSLGNGWYAVVAGSPGLQPGTVAVNLTVVGHDPLYNVDIARQWSETTELRRTTSAPTVGR